MTLGAFWSALAVQESAHVKSSYHQQEGRSKALLTGGGVATMAAWSSNALVSASGNKARNDTCIAQRIEPLLRTNREAVVQTASICRGQHREKTNSAGSVSQYSITPDRIQELTTTRVVSVRVLPRVFLNAASASCRPPSSHRQLKLAAVQAGPTARRTRAISHSRFGTVTHRRAILRWGCLFAQNLVWFSTPSILCAQEYG